MSSAVSAMWLRQLSIIAVLALAAAGLGACKIRYDSDAATSATNSEQGAFNAKTYVDGIWTAKVVPFLQSQPVDVAVLLDAIAKDPDGAGKQYGHRAGDGQPWTFLVKGQGTVKSVDVTSRHGTMTLEANVDGTPTPIMLQVGPVIFGTALRDSLPFVAFGDFVNQIDYAEVSRALNDKATASVHPGDLANAVGKTVTFVGAAVSPSGSTPLTITPIALTVAGGSP